MPPATQASPPVDCLLRLPAGATQQPLQRSDGGRRKQTGDAGVWGTGVRRLASGGRKPLLSLNGRRLAGYLGLAAIAAAMAQLMLGASLSVVVFALLATTFGLLGFAALGAYNLGAWVALFYALGNVLVALYAKTLMGQPLDSNLYMPLDSFLVLAATSGGLFAALLLIRRLGVGRPIFASVRDPHFLAYFSWACFALGVLFWILNRLFQDPGASGFGGVALFGDLLFMAVIARTAALLEKSDNRRAFDGRLGGIIAVAAFLGLVDNSKTMAALPVVSYFVTVMFYRCGFPFRSLIILAAGVFLFSAAVAPMVQALRAMGQYDLSLSQRIGFVTSNVTNVIENPEQFNRFELLAAGQFKHGYYDYFGGSGAGQMLLGRYASVQQIDPVIAEVNHSHPWGGEAVWPALARLVPSFIYRNKPEYIEAYNTLVHFRLVDPAGGKFPTLPLAGQAYAAYGVWGLLTIPFITFLGFLLVMKKLGWQLYRNVYAIFFLCDFVFVYVSQGDFGQYAGAALRSLPLFAVVFWLIGKSYRLRLRRRHRRQAVLLSTPRPQASLLQDERHNL